eukprot:g18165.t1
MKGGAPGGGGPNPGGKREWGEQRGGYHHQQHQATNQQYLPAQHQHQTGGKAARSDKYNDGSRGAGGRGGTREDWSGERDHPHEVLPKGLRLQPEAPLIGTNTRGGGNFNAGGAAALPPHARSAPPLSEPPAEPLHQMGEYADRAVDDHWGPNNRYATGLTSSEASRNGTNGSGGDATHNSGSGSDGYPYKNSDHYRNNDGLRGGAGDYDLRDRDDVETSTGEAHRGGFRGRQKGRYTTEDGRGFSPDESDSNFALDRGGGRMDAYGGGFSSEEHDEFASRDYRTRVEQQQGRNVYTGTTTRPGTGGYGGQEGTPPRGKQDASRMDHHEQQRSGRRHRENVLYDEDYPHQEPPPSRSRPPRGPENHDDDPPPGLTDSYGLRGDGGSYDSRLEEDDGEPASSTMGGGSARGNTNYRRDHQHHRRGGQESPPRGDRRGASAFLHRTVLSGPEPGKGTDRDRFNMEKGGGRPQRGGWAPRGGKDRGAGAGSYNFRDFSPEPRGERGMTNNRSARYKMNYDEKNQVPYRAQRVPPERRRGELDEDFPRDDDSAVLSSSSRNPSHYGPSDFEVKICMDVVAYVSNMPENLNDDEIGELARNLGVHRMGIVKKTRFRNVAEFLRRVSEQVGVGVGGGGNSRGGTSRDVRDYYYNKYDQHQQQQAQQRVYARQIYKALDLQVPGSSASSAPAVADVAGNVKPADEQHTEEPPRGGDTEKDDLVRRLLEKLLLEEQAGGPSVASTDGAGDQRGGATDSEPGVPAATSSSSASAQLLVKTLEGYINEKKSITAATATSPPPGGKQKQSAGAGGSTSGVPSKDGASGDSGSPQEAEKQDDPANHSSTTSNTASASRAVGVTSSEQTAIEVTGVLVQQDTASGKQGMTFLIIYAEQRTKGFGIDRFAARRQVEEVFSVLNELLHKKKGSAPGAGGAKVVPSADNPGPATVKKDFLRRQVAFEMSEELDRQLAPLFGLKTAQEPQRAGVDNSSSGNDENADAVEDAEGSTNKNSEYKYTTRAALEKLVRHERETGQTRLSVGEQIRRRERDVRNENSSRGPEALVLGTVGADSTVYPIDGNWLFTGDRDAVEFVAHAIHRGNEIDLKRVERKFGRTASQKQRGWIANYLQEAPAGGGGGNGKPLLSAELMNPNGKTSIGEPVSARSIGDVFLAWFMDRGGGSSRWLYKMIKIKFDNPVSEHRRRKVNWQCDRITRERGVVTYICSHEIATPRVKATLLQRGGRWAAEWRELPLRESFGHMTNTLGIQASSKRTFLFLQPPANGEEEEDDYDDMAALCRPPGNKNKNVEGPGSSAASGEDAAEGEGETVVTESSKGETSQRRDEVEVLDAEAVLRAAAEKDPPGGDNRGRRPVKSSKTASCSLRRCRKNQSAPGRLVVDKHEAFQRLVASNPIVLRNFHSKQVVSLSPTPPSALAFSLTSGYGAWCRERCAQVHMLPHFTDMQTVWRAGLDVPEPHVLAELQGGALNAFIKQLQAEWAPPSPPSSPGESAATAVEDNDKILSGAAVSATAIAEVKSHFRRSDQYQWQFEDASLIQRFFEGRNTTTNKTVVARLDCELASDAALDFSFLQGFFTAFVPAKIDLRDGGGMPPQSHSSSCDEIFDEIHGHVAYSEGGCGASRNTSSTTVDEVDYGASDAASKDTCSERSRMSDTTAGSSTENAVGSMKMGMATTTMGQTLLTLNADSSASTRSPATSADSCTTPGSRSASVFVDTSSRAHGYGCAAPTLAGADAGRSSAAGERPTMMSMVLHLQRIAGDEHGIGEFFEKSDKACERLGFSPFPPAVVCLFRDGYKKAVEFFERRYGTQMAEEGGILQAQIISR